MSPAAATVEALRGALGERAAAIDVECVAETGSTNADLLAWARTQSAAGRPRLRVAERQTAGRGRHGRSWQAAPGASLTFSLAWPLASAQWSGLSLAVGVAVAEAIAPARGEERRVGLKWPNDLWLVGGDGEGRKLGGILIETAPLDADRIAVVGVGVNVLEQPVADASSGVAWLREIDATATPRSTLLRIAPALVEALARFERDGFAAFAARFAALDLLRGRAVRCRGTDPASEIEGVAAGVSPNGELLLRTTRGLQAIGSGEVSVRLADGRAGTAPPCAARLPC